MSGIRTARTTLAALAAAVLLPTVALAQTGAIAGSVADETGGVLPGVTVEAASPALIGGVRATVTDGAGLYTIEALRPGTYSVTFTLPGFSNVRARRDRADLRLHGERGRDDDGRLH